MTSMPPPGSGWANNGYADQVRGLWEAANKEGRRWARPEAPILHDLVDERAEPYVAFQNGNYRTSRKYINVEKAHLLRDQTLVCIRTAGNAKHHKCMEVLKRFQAATRVVSNVDRGGLARKRDVGFIYHTTKMKELQRQAAELEVPFPL